MNALLAAMIAEMQFFEADTDTDTDNRWSVENEGVAPDIEVALDPIAANEGRDTQLEKAIAEILSQLEGFVSPVSTEAPRLPTELGQ